MTGSSVDNNIFSCKTKLQKSSKNKRIISFKKTCYTNFPNKRETQSIIYYLLSRDPEYRICIET